MKCSCPDWVPNITQIDDAILLSAEKGIQYTGKHFEYCPWCGRPLLKCVSSLCESVGKLHEDEVGKP